ncbi:hypothetical protein [Paenibacillus sp. Marseille-Q4541]|uniref:hypothetical protein n=1 Tax=Paenibacillus sp. Marseille-Q4541 TaxID=2831522 RepID=UPI001BA74663|nr:hypothetical protein [Paenibacillus sp. Marseille-Q4541]
MDLHEMAARARQKKLSWYEWMQININYTALHFKETDSLTLEAKGFFMSKPEQVFTFNTETVETIQTLDSHIVLDKVEEREDQIQISISTKGLYVNTKYPYFNPYVQIFNEDNMLTDATGKEYPMADASL